MWMSSFCSVHCSRVATAKAANTRQNLTPCSIMLSKAAAAGSCRILAGALQQLALEGGACCASSCLQTQGTCSRTGALPAAWQTSRGFAAAADPPQGDCMDALHVLLLQLALLIHCCALQSRLVQPLRQQQSLARV